MTNGLDIPTVRSLRALLRKMRDHIVVISRGRLAAQGTAEGICSQADAATLEDAFVRLTGREKVAS